MTTNRPQAASASVHQPLDRRTLLTTTATFGLGALAFPFASPASRALANQATPITTEAATPPAGAVYAMTNGDGIGNAIVAFARSGEGLLTYLSTTATSGEGTGRRRARRRRSPAGSTR